MFQRHSSSLRERSHVQFFYERSEVKECRGVSRAGGSTPGGGAR